MNGLATEVNGLAVTRDCPYGICCPWVRGGWNLDALGKLFGRCRHHPFGIPAGHVGLEILFSGPVKVWKPCFRTDGCFPDWSLGLEPFSTCRRLGLVGMTCKARTAATIVPPARQSPHWFRTGSGLDMESTFQTELVQHFPPHAILRI